MLILTEFWHCSDDDNDDVRDQFTVKDASVVKQVFKYTMNVLHAAIAVESERRCKLQTEVFSDVYYLCMLVEVEVKVMANTCYSAFYIKRSVARSTLTISEVVADRHELMIPQHTMRPPLPV